MIAAPFTPFKKDGSLNLTQIAPIARHLSATGVSGAFICGTTGEGSSMTTEERKLVASQWMKVRDNKLKIIVHVGGNCLSDAKELAKHAQQIGADAIAAIAPCFFKPATLHELIEWCASIAKAAPKTPFYYYHMPSMSGVNFPMAAFLPLAAKYIPSFGGIKFTYENIMDYGLAIDAAKGKYDILFGRDEILLSALAVGAKGAVGSTYNYAAPLYAKVIKAFKEGDMVAAKKAQIQAMKIIAAFCKYPGMDANKAIMRLIGIDCGHTRQPISHISKADEARMKKDLQKAGLFDLL